MIHEDAVDLIQYFEGCDNVAAACPSHVSNGGKWPYLTIGFGHSGPDVTPGMKITTAQAKQLLARDLANVETMVRDLVKVTLNDGQYGAFCALVFNVKPGLINRSRTLAKLNARDYGSFDMASAYRDDLGSLTGMAREWAEFRGVEKAAGGVEHLRGLVRRRACELELFFTGQWSVPRDQKQPQALYDAQQSNNVLRPGMRSTDISALHEALSAAGFPVVCSDAYTWATTEAVRAFQQRNGLTADGIYGMETARKLADVLGVSVQA